MLLAAGLGACREARPDILIWTVGSPHEDSFQVSIDAELALRTLDEQGSSASVTSIEEIRKVRVWILTQVTARYRSEPVGSN